MINLSFFYKTLNSIPRSSRLEGKKCLFVTVRSLPFIMHQELFLANILARNGAQVYILLDDGQLPHWDTYQLHDKGVELNPSKTIKNKLVRTLLLSLYKNKKIQVIYTSKIAKKLGGSAYENQQLSEGDVYNAISSVRRYSESGFFDENNEIQKAYYLKTLENERRMKAFITYLYETLNFDVAITSHGIYSIWGTAYNYLKEQGVKLFVYGAHSYRKSHTFFTDTIAQTLSKDSDCIRFMKEVQLTEEEKQRVDDYFTSRRNHNAKDTAIYYSWMKEKENLTVKRQRKDTINYGMFPNIIWDGDVVQRDTIFAGMFDWMVKTIQFFINNPQHNLVIRFHPAEASMWKDSVKLSDTILSVFPDLEKYENIKLIYSNQQVDTYDFVKNNIDVGLVYDGILALELLHMHIPVLSPSCNRYVTGDFTVNPTSQSEYFNLLKDFPFEDYFTDEKNQAFYKYSYWYLFLSAYLMPIYSNKVFRKAIYDRSTIEKTNSLDFKLFYDRLMRV